MLFLSEPTDFTGIKLWNKNLFEKVTSVLSILQQMGLLSTKQDHPQSLPNLYHNNSKQEAVN